MTAAEVKKKKDREFLCNLHKKYYGNKKENEVAKRAGVKQSAVKKNEGISRAELMEQAKTKGIKNFRVLNKEELVKVLDPKATKKIIDKVVQGAVARWKGGWGGRSKQKT